MNAPWWSEPCQCSSGTSRETNGAMATSDARLRELLADGMDATVLPASALALAAECVLRQRTLSIFFPLCKTAHSLRTLMCRAAGFAITRRRLGYVSEGAAIAAGEGSLSQPDGGLFSPPSSQGQDVTLLLSQLRVRLGFVIWCSGPTFVFTRVFVQDAYFLPR